MSSPRKIQGLYSALREDIDDLVTYRAFPSATMGMERLEPFIFLNHHGHQIYPPGNSGLPFGPHPHRGFETVTFIFAGDLAHQDSGGHRSVIRAGGIQWMTAGSGLIHAELSSDEFLRQGGELEILQLWVNLPARLKMTPPRYVGLQENQIPSLTLDEGRVQLHSVSGNWNATQAPLQSISDVHLSWIEFQRGGRFQQDVSPERRVLLYVVRGGIEVNGKAVEARRGVEFAQEGSRITMEARENSLILLGHAAPLGEPIAAYGPFVMNTEAEIHQAMRDFRAGKFGSFQGL